MTIGHDMQPERAVTVHCALPRRSAMTWSVSLLVDQTVMSYDAGDRLNGSLYLCDVHGGTASEYLIEQLRECNPPLWSAEPRKQIAPEQKAAYKEGLVFQEAREYHINGSTVVLLRCDHPKFPSNEERWSSMNEVANKLADGSALNAIRTLDRFSSTRALMHSLDVVLRDLNDSERREVIAARNLSIECHFHQSDRADGAPYVNHPMEVMIAVAERFGLKSVRVLQAAALHDCLEDQPHKVVSLLNGDRREGETIQSAALRCIHDRFGSRVAEIVSALTNPDFDEMVAQAQRAGDQRAAREIEAGFYKDHFIEILHKDPEAFAIKLSDFSKNAFAIDALEEGPKKQWLTQKYGPVILATIHEVGSLPENGHVLSHVKETLTHELTDIYSRHYRAE